MKKIRIMGEYATLYEELFEKAKEYTKTSYELLKLQALEKSTSVLSSFVSKLVVIVFTLAFVLFISFAVSFWLGDLLGKIYYGFLIVAGLYAAAAVIARFVVYKRIKKRVGDAIIMHVLK
jgi:hypothetical protein